jgi:hypothetical protein
MNAERKKIIKALKIYKIVSINNPFIIMPFEIPRSLHKMCLPKYWNTLPGIYFATCDLFNTTKLSLKDILPPKLDTSIFQTEVNRVLFKKA